MANITVQHSTDDWSSIVAANVRAEMGRAGLNQAQLATALGMSEMWMTRRLKKGVAFTADDIAMFASFFGVSVADLFDTKKAPTPKGEGRSAPRTGLEPIPAGFMPSAIVTTLRPRHNRTVEHDHLAPVTTISA